MIAKDPKKSYEIMGADVKQSGEQFGNSAKYLRWQDQAANKKFFAGEHAQFSKEAADLLLEIGVIKQQAISAYDPRVVEATGISMMVTMISEMLNLALKNAASNCPSPCRRSWPG